MNPVAHGSALGAGPEGFVIVDKPPGATSFKILAKIKRRFDKSVKIGHAGTLDSFASGVLVVLFGRYTRLSDYFMNAGKVYEALVAFGSETDTLDPDGSVVARGSVPTQDALESVLHSFRGTIMQAPPAYSAVHVDGKRAYERARKGETVEPAARSVTINELNLLSFKDGEARFRVSCSKGTYIRSLARDIAIGCGSRAHLGALRRTFSGSFSIEEAIPPEEIDPSRIRRLGLVDAVDLGLEPRTLGTEEAKAFANGLPLSRIGSFADRVGETPVAAFGPDGALLGVAAPDGGRWRYAMVFEGSA
ncbi:MAG: tRNA pseudouridine(55) synthase TruB [Spirochaetales bacterium]|nr:MAG: tRNA pseudouridine(55) synthase TruB [Spirochaetales bacterium]